MISREYLKRIREVELRTRRLAEDHLVGAYRSVFKGRGLDFEDVRAYAAGDDVRFIDWNVTARMHAPFVRQFTEEREISVILAVDVSASGSFGAGVQTKRELAAEAAACLAFSALGNGDKAGLLLFSDHVETWLPPRKGRRQALRLLREALFHRPRHAGTSLRTAINFLNQVQGRRAIIFLISDFLDEGYERTLKVAGLHHDVIPLVLTDPREQTLPEAGLVVLQDAETGECIEVDSARPEVRADFARLAAARRLELRQRFFRIGTDLIELGPGEPPHRAIQDYMERRVTRRSIA